jgi:hypothetical protein
MAIHSWLSRPVMRKKCSTPSACNSYAIAVAVVVVAGAATGAVTGATASTAMGVIITGPPQDPEDECLSRRPSAGR